MSLDDAFLIAALLKRKMSKDDAFGLERTSVLLVGPHRTAKALDYAGFKEAVV